MDKTGSALFLLYPSTLTNITDSLGLKLPTNSGGKPSMIIVVLQKVIPLEFPDVGNVAQYPIEWSNGLRKLVGDQSYYQRTARYFGIEPKVLEILQDCPFSIYNEY